MAQLKEDEWPDSGEQTTTEREVPREDRHSQEQAPDRPPGSVRAAVPKDDARLKNVTPDEAVD
jgi:hypothetical protein